MMSPLYDLNQRSNSWDPRLKEALAYIVPTTVAVACFWGVLHTPFPWNLILGVIGGIASVIEIFFLIGMLIYYTTK